MLPKNIIIAPYCLYAKFSRYGRYNKKVEYSVYCPNDKWYYISKVGKVREVDSNGTIWSAILDELGWPTGYQQRIR